MVYIIDTGQNKKKDSPEEEAAKLKLLKYFLIFLVIVIIICCFKYGVSTVFSTIFDILGAIITAPGYILV